MLEEWASYVNCFQLFRYKHYWSCQISMTEWSNEVNSLWSRDLILENKPFPYFRVGPFSFNKIYQINEVTTNKNQKTPLKNTLSWNLMIDDTNVVVSINFLFNFVAFQMIFRCKRVGKMSKFVLHLDKMCFCKLEKM